MMRNVCTFAQYTTRIELEKKRKAAAERKLLLEDEYATLGGGRLGKLRSVSLARAAEALEEKESSAKKGRSDFAYVPGRYAGRGVSGAVLYNVMYYCTLRVLFSERVLCIHCLCLIIYLVALCINLISYVRI